MNPIKKWLRKREIRKEIRSRESEFVLAYVLYEGNREFQATILDLRLDRIENLKRELNELD